MKPKSEVVGAAPMIENIVDALGDEVEPLALAATVERPVAVWPSSMGDSHSDLIAREVAIALVYNGVSHAVMMASPFELEAFALGFSFTERIISRAEDVYAIDIVEQEKGIEVRLTIASQSFMQLKARRRSLVGRTGCGICGAQSLEQVCQPVEMINTHFEISHTAIDRATAELESHQPLQELTGAVHGAAWCDTGGNVVSVCEDVGRHNALDKLIGLLNFCPAIDQKASNLNAFSQPGFLLISSRASYEIVQKAAAAGIAMIAAVSAPTSLAIDIAEEAGITLIGFSRQHRHVAYTHSQRLTQE